MVYEFRVPEQPLIRVLTRFNELRGTAQGQTAFLHFTKVFSYTTSSLFHFWGGSLHPPHVAMGGE